MSHYRQQILTATQALCDGIASDPNVKEANTFAHANLPAVSYELDSDGLTGTTKDGNQEHELIVLITVAAVTSAVRDQICLEIEQAIVASPLSSDQSFDGTELQTDKSSEEFVFGAQMTYSVRFFVAEADPSTIVA